LPYYFILAWGGGFSSENGVIIFLQVLILVKIGVLFLGFSLPNLW